MAAYEAYLRTALAKYEYADITKRDILNALRSYTDLRPMKDTFIFNDGKRQELLCLTGTIPVSFKGSTYNIPICLWLMTTHPYNPPMVYVRPTATMQIKPGKHVDTNGKIYLPYLHEWKHPQSDLYGLIQILSIVFGEEPPVFAKSSAGPPRPAYPPQSRPNLPYPNSGGAMPMPTLPASSGNTGYPANPSYPGYPGYPAQATQPSSAYPGYSSAGYAQPTATQAPSYGGYPSQPANSTTVASGNSLSDEQIKASLLTAVEDKMRRRLKEIFAQAQAELDVLKKTEEDLQKGKQTLDSMLQKLETEQNEVERNITLLQEKDEELRSSLEKVEGKEDIPIDDIVLPAAPLYRQLLTAFAEEQATADAIYYLGEALRRGVIDLDVFLKQVRGLSRKQFLLRALVHKCRQKAGLPDLTG
ncbi:hypothetical protein CAPTEDRAFT_155778 [Capitella teleta]|uniref:UEV domain-containing protein n=1 Tax=Capitella teleta TaxID=283909 RepID=R7V940_CAPTE|nr:hypothetical protein CAPTEDRAFT_155778 [Capitella teleta]|eukprot:ELU15363.1 hypothetical protein CAPTEDRAFT_155778 [Capitella teleta]